MGNWGKIYQILVNLCKMALMSILKELDFGPQLLYLVYTGINSQKEKSNLPVELFA